MKQAKFIIYPRYDQFPCIQLQLIVINCGLPHSNEYTVLVYAKTRLIGSSQCRNYIWNFVFTKIVQKCCGIVL